MQESFHGTAIDAFHADAGFLDVHSVQHRRQHPQLPCPHHAPHFLQAVRMNTDGDDLWYSDLSMALSNRLRKSGTCLRRAVVSLLSREGCRYFLLKRCLTMAGRPPSWLS